MNSNKPRSIPRIPFILILALTLLGGCGGGSSGDESIGDAQAETAQAADPGKMFGESVKEDKCALLTPA